jgi:uncharacterized protein
VPDGIQNTDWPRQISSVEALPFGEVKSNPYAVLCTTSLGGHLGWFETGGGRWHSQPVCIPPHLLLSLSANQLFKVANFMNYMAFEVRLDTLKTNANKNGKIYHSGAEFDPMRRKMAVPLD